MRRLIFSFALGVAALQFQAELAPWPLLATILLGALGGLFWGAARGALVVGWRSVLLIVLAACLGFAWAGLRAHLRLAEQLPEAWERRDIVVRGVVAGLPQRFERGERFDFDVEAVLTPGAQVLGRILLSWYHGWDELDARDIDEEGASPAARALRPGERWQFTLRLKRPHGSANPHGFDYEAWLLERGVRATGTVRARSEAQRLDAFVWRPGYVVERLRDSLRERFLSTLPNSPYLGVLIALAIGDQRAIPVDQWQIFNRTGVTHLVSISGLHVTMLAALIAAVVNALWRCSPRLMLAVPAQRAALLAGWLGALAYTLIAGFEVPAQRTLYMLGVLLWTVLSGRNYGVSRTLLLALFVVLLIDPWAVLATGFWLSFGAVAVLLYAGTGRRGSDSAPQTSRWLSFRRASAEWGLAQWAVTLGSLPLLLFFFQQCSLVSPLANAVAIPVVSLIVTPLALLFAVVPWAPLLHLAHAVLAGLMQVLLALADWPVWQQAAPPFWALALAMLGVAWLLLPRGFPGRVVGVVLLLPALAYEPARPVSGEAWVDVLDVGQGLAVFVRTARHNLLYDAGPLYSAQANAGDRVVLPHLKALVVTQLDMLMISHRDKDHAGGADTVRAALDILSARSSMREPGYAPCLAGEAWSWDGVRFSVLHPDKEEINGRGRSTNALSCVLRIESAQGARLLLTGDIEGRAERALLRRHADRPEILRADALVVPHHGGAGSSSAEFVTAVAAEHALISAGYRNAFGHPRPEVLERYAPSTIWRTDRDGALTIRLGGQADVLAQRQQRPRYWHGR